MRMKHSMICLNLDGHIIQVIKAQIQTHEKKLNIPFRAWITVAVVFMFDVWSISAQQTTKTPRHNKPVELLISALCLIERNLFFVILLFFLCWHRQDIERNNSERRTKHIYSALSMRTWARRTHVCTIWSHMCARSRDVTMWLFSGLWRQPGINRFPIRVAGGIWVLFVYSQHVWRREGFEIDVSTRGTKCIMWYNIIMFATENRIVLFTVKFDKNTRILSYGINKNSRCISMICFVTVYVAILDISNPNSVCVISTHTRMAAFVMRPTFARHGLRACPLSMCINNIHIL